jgi:hypothetical protein
MKSLFRKISGGESTEISYASQVVNPSSTEVFFRAGELTFKCPTCPSAVFVTRQQIDPVIGINVVCPGCRNVSHVPGGYKTEPNPIGLKITAGVQVPIARFADWYFEHPLISSLVKSGQSDLLNEYGLWGFCAGCYHQFPATTLGMLPVAQRAGGFVFTARTPDSAKDMDSLRAGHCSSCTNKNLIVVVTDIPDYVRTTIVEHRKK